MKRDYKNYEDQVNANVSNLILFNEISKIEFWYEDAYEQYAQVYENLSREALQDFTDEDITEIHDDELSELISDLIFQDLDAYQYYHVSLRGRFNDEHARLGIFYLNELDMYIMPVSHFGTSWDYVGSVNYLHD